MRDALPAAAAAGVIGVHDKDGGRGAPELFAALRDAGELTLRVWQSLPAERRSPATPRPRPRTAGCCGSATSRRSWTARSARAPRGCSTAPASRSRAAAALAEIVRARRARPASPSPCTRSATSPTATRSTPSRRRGRLAPRGLRHRIEHAQCVAPRRRAALRAARRRRLGAVHARDERPRPRRPPVGATAPRTPIPSARCWRRARGSPAARTRRSRSSTRSRGCGPRSCARTRPPAVAARAGDRPRTLRSRPSPPSRRGWLATSTPRAARARASRRPRRARPRSRRGLEAPAWPARCSPGSGPLTPPGSA